MIRRPPRSTRTDHSFPTRRSSDLHIVVRQTRWRLVDLEEVTTKLSEIFGPPTSSTTDLVNRSEEHTSELQSLMRISYAVFCLKKKNKSEDIQTLQPTDLT